jgi:hypothetical protein
MNLFVLFQKASGKEIARMLLNVTGCLLVFFGIFSGFVAFALQAREHDLRYRLMCSAIIVSDGIGFLLPRLGAKLSASVLLAVSAVWMFFTDSFGLQNLWIYCLSLVPLILTLWLLRSNSSLPVGRVTNAD